jgi:hypothetical protein
MQRGLMQTALKKYGASLEQGMKGEIAPSIQLFINNLRH